MRFPIRFDAWYRPISWMALIPPSSSYIEVEDDFVEIKMGWAFSARFPRAAIRSVRASEHVWLTRGAHGMGGSWLVNGSGDGIVCLELEPSQRARTMIFPINLHQLLVSLEDPDAFAACVRGRTSH